jgi:cytochrome c556
MRKWTIVTAAAALAVGVAWTGGYAADGDQPQSVKQIMTKAHKGSTSLIRTIGTELKKPTPDFDSLAPKTKELADLGGQLGKNDPPKGEKDSWQKLCGLYADAAKDLNDAVGKKDKDSALMASGKISNSCMACHRLHRGE